MTFLNTMDVDVDPIQATRNSPFINFFDVATAFPWQEPRPEQIRLRRALMDDTLIFDILLTSGGIDDLYQVYPPENADGLQRLLDAIQSSNYDALKKDCLVYFLLKWHQDGRERGFQEQRCIPPQFAALADAYWHLDTGINVPRAIAMLSDARLNRDYASKIIRAISLSPDSAPLIRQYIQTAKPIMVEPPDIEYYALALADSSILEAWQFARTFNEEDVTRTRLLQKIFEWTVTPAPRPVALKQLIALPLSTFEEGVLNEFVQKPPTPMAIKFSAIAILQDLICVRLIQGGRYKEAIKLDKLFTSTTAPKYLKDTRDRSKMVQDVYAALAPVEKALVALELDPESSSTQGPHQMQHSARKPVSPENRRVPPQELSQSWEEVHVPETLISKSTPLRDVRVPTTTPRYGAHHTPSGSTSTPGAPLLPINLSTTLNGLASGSTPRKNFPLAASVLHGSAAKPRSSLSGTGLRMTFGTPGAFASPASGMKLPGSPFTLGASSPASRGPAATAGHTFLSASQQQNAFYKPPPVKTNGTSRALEEDVDKSPERITNDSASAKIDDVRMEVETDAEKDAETEKEDSTFEVEPRLASKRGRKDSLAASTDEEEEGVLQYSVFGGKAKQELPQKSISATTRRGTKKSQKAPPGSFRSEEDAMEEDHEEAEQKKTISGRTRSSRPSRAAKAAPAPAASSKPPAKKARQSKAKPLSRSIPGGLMDEDDLEPDEVADENEEQDEVAPLPVSRSRATARPVRKSRSSVSADTAEELAEGVQTRRRSSRLTIGGGSASVGGSVHSGGSPEPPSAPVPKTRKGTRSGGATKKKR